MQRWIKQVEDESYSASVEDGTESTSSQQSTSSRSTPNPLSTGTYIPTAIWTMHYSESTEAERWIRTKQLGGIIPKSTTK